MKVHIGVDAVLGIVHRVVGTPANVSDISQAAQLLHGEKQITLADAGYIGVEKREELQESTVNWVVPAKRKAPGVCSVC